MDLPKNEYSFTFSEIGERTKKRYEGSFTVKCLLTMDELRIVAIKMDILNGGSKTLVPGVVLLNRAIAELDVRMISSPAFWRDGNDGRSMFDTNIVLDVFNMALDAERDYDTRIESQGEKAEEVQKQSASKTKKNKE